MHVNGIWKCMGECGGRGKYVSGRVVGTGRERWRKQVRITSPALRIENLCSRVAQTSTVCFEGFYGVSTRNGFGNDLPFHALI